ncbi:aldehyde dehydrogenase PuuC, partial [Vibrio fluvialis]|nr:aldehyde dehydrogenase PuuC [Vibrio fluvialis]
MKTQQQWMDLRQQHNIEGRAFINGQYQDSLSGETFEVINPATEEVIAYVARCSDQDAIAAVEYAKGA